MKQNKNWVEFVKTATCCDRKGCFLILKNTDEQASEELKNYYNLVVDGDWEVNHIYEINEIEYLVLELQKKLFGI